MVLLVGVVPVTDGAVGAVVSIVMAKLPLVDQLPASSRSWTYKVWAAALSTEPDVYVVDVVVVAPEERSELSSLYR